MTAMFSLEICVRLYQAQKRVQDRDLDSLGDSLTIPVTYKAESLMRYWTAVAAVSSNPCFCLVYCDLLIRASVTELQARITYMK